jgi:hypothetical protein
MDKPIARLPREIPQERLACLFSPFRRRNLLAIKVPDPASMRRLSKRKWRSTQNKPKTGFAHSTIA